MNNTEKISLEYSVSQNCFHIDFLSRIIETNRMNVLDQNSMDFQLLGIFDSWEAAEEAVKDFRRINPKL